MRIKPSRPILPMLLTNAAIGIAIGTSIELAFSAALHGPYTAGVPSFRASFDNELTAILVERLVYAALGVVMGASAGLFRMERISLPMATASHLAICAGSVLAAGTYLHWFDLEAGLPFAIGSMLLVYGAIWVVSWLWNRRTIDRMNANLPRR